MVFTINMSLELRYFVKWIDVTLWRYVSCHLTPSAQKNMSSRFAQNYEESASEFKKILIVINMFKTSNTHWCVTLLNGLNSLCTDRCVVCGIVLLIPVCIYKFQNDVENWDRTSRLNSCITNINKWYIHSSSNTEAPSRVSTKIYMRTLWTI